MLKEPRVLHLSLSLCVCVCVCLICEESEESLGSKGSGAVWGGGEWEWVMGIDSVELLSTVSLSLAYGLKHASVRVTCCQMCICKLF